MYPVDRNQHRPRKGKGHPSLRSNPPVLELNKPMKASIFATLTVIAAAAWAIPCTADSTEARCDIYPKGSDRLEKMIPCTFGQRQGYITITRADGVSHDLEPIGDAPGNFRDEKGRTVYRQSGLGNEGQIFRFPDESVYVYWDASALSPSKQDNPSAPFATRRDGGDFNATTVLRCKAAGDSEYGNCPAGIMRMDNGQASITIQSQLGKQFAVNFMTDSVNAANHQVDAKLKGDTWTLTLENGEVYEVPLAAVEGG
jgi:hypothetical protein